MEFIIPLLSAILGLIILNTTVLLHSRASTTGWIVEFPVEVRYFIYLSFIMLIGLNGNQLLSGDILFPLLITGCILSIYRAFRKLTLEDLKAAAQDGLSLLLVQATVLIFIVLAFRTHEYFLLELHNHDSLYYYEGSHWALEERLFVSNNAVHSKWGGGDYFIGYDVPLYRGGTYTLGAWVQFLSPQMTANGLYYILAYAATMAWFAVRVFSKSMNGHKAFICTTILALLVSFSTGLTGALANSNLATVMGSASLMIVFAVALRSDIKFKVRYGLMAAWCAICSQFYGESVFYAGLLSFLVFLFELPTLRKSLGIRGIVRFCLILFAFLIAAGNVPLIQSFSSLVLFSDIAGGGNWFSWYLHHSIFTWVGSFVAGILMGFGISIAWVVVAGLITALATACLLILSSSRSGILALLCTSILAIVFIELSFYQYGEHKIVHLLGPSWTLAVVATTIYLAFGSDLTGPSRFMFSTRTTALMSLSAPLACIIISSLWTVVTALNQFRSFHSLDFGLSTMASHVRPGDSILLDDTGWVGVEKFLKSHYLAFELQRQKAQVLLPSTESDALRGGYQRNALSNTFHIADSIDWLVKGQNSALILDKLIAPTANPIWQNNDFRLYRVANEPLAVAGNGWYDCENALCWTMSPFEIESHTPTASAYELVIDFTLFSAPPDGVITVKTSAGDILAEVGSDSNQMRIKLPIGWSRLVFEPNWQVFSPKELDISADTRKLFLAVKRVEIKVLSDEGVSE